MISMKAKSGKKIEAIKPQKPAEVFEADDAIPGKIAEIKAVQKTKAAGKYGETKLPAHKPAASESAPESQKNKVSPTSKGTSATSAQPADSSSSEEKTGWINIKLVDEKGNAVAGEAYEIVLPEGTLAKGTLDIDGTAKVKGFDAGNCIVRFPQLVKGSVSKK